VYSVTCYIRTEWNREDANFGGRLWTGRDRPIYSVFHTPCPSASFRLCSFETFFDVWSVDEMDTYLAFLATKCVAFR